jgi:phosphoglycolate phosphatase-like HAD superfamily hydrolase
MVETIRHGAAAPGARAALFDFDGTLSLIRSGWLEIMLDMIVETLAALGTGESAERLRGQAFDAVWPLTGKDTIYQMRAFARAIEQRGGTPLHPEIYKQRFLDRLFGVSEQRTADLRGGRAAPDQYLVPGARAILEELRGRGLTLYLASGTDDPRLQEEAVLLDIARYFDGGIYGALPDPQAFSKRMLIERIVSAPGMRPDRLIGFGDGPTEIEDLRRAGSIAVGMATDEPACQQPSPFKRTSLIASGADYIVPNYLCRQGLLPLLFAQL